MIIVTVKVGCINLDLSNEGIVVDLWKLDVRRARIDDHSVSPCCVQIDFKEVFNATIRNETSLECPGWIVCLSNQGRLVLGLITDRLWDSTERDVGSLLS